MPDTPDSTPDSKVAQTDHAISDVFAERWSPRSFADRPVAPETLQRVLEAARWTMSSYNEQPWRYVVATQDDPDAFERMLGCLTAFNQSWAESAPVLMMSFVRTTFSKNDTPNRCALHDVGAASAALTFQATELDLYVHQMAGIHQDKAADRYDVPEPFEAVAGLALGYLGAPENLSDELQERERAERTRMPLSAFVFADQWGTPAPWLSD